MKQIFLATVITLQLLAVSPLAAQPVPMRMPGSTHVFPAGGRRGTTVELRVGAECIPPGTNFYWSGKGVSAPNVLGDRLPFLGEPSPRRLPTEIPITYPKEWQSRVEIGADAPLGLAYWRLSCAQGGTASRPFVVGDLPEYVERESNSLAERAERVALPVTINGQICGERDVDYFRLTSPGDGYVVCEVLAARLGSPLDPVIDVLDAAGQPLEVVKRRLGSDVAIVFSAKAAPEVLLRVANVSEAGSPAHIYRLNVITAATLEAAFPGEDAAGVTPESENNDTAERAQLLTVPAVVGGRFNGPRDDDCYRFAAQANQPVAITCRASPAGGAALPTMLLTDGTGQEVARARGIESADGVCRLEWKPAATGEFRLRLRDVRPAAVGGDEFAYRLSIEPARPDFALLIASDCVNVPQGGKTTVDVAVRRSGGFIGPIELRLERDSERSPQASGVTVETTTIPENAVSFKLNLAAAETAASECTPWRLIGRAKVGEESVERTAQARHFGCDAGGVSVGASTLDQLQVTVLHKPVFRLQCGEAYQYAHRGTVYPYLMEIERLDGFNGEITLQIGDRQNRDLDGIEMREVLVPAGQSQVMLPIYLPESMHINVQSQSQLYSQAHATFVDKHGRRQAVLVVSEKRNMLRTLPPMVKLKAAIKERSAAPGSEVVCRLELERTSNFTGPMELEMIDSPLMGKLKCEKGTIAAGQLAGELRVILPADAPHGTSVTLKFRATGKLSGSGLVLSEDEVRLVILGQ